MKSRIAMNGKWRLGIPQLIALISPFNLTFWQKKSYTKVSFFLHDKRSKIVLTLAQLLWLLPNLLYTTPSHRLQTMLKLAHLLIVQTSQMMSDTLNRIPLIIYLAPPAFPPFFFGINIWLVVLHSSLRVKEKPKSIGSIVFSWKYRSSMIIFPYVCDHQV